MHAVGRRRLGWGGHLGLRRDSPIRTWPKRYRILLICLMIVSYVYRFSVDFFEIFFSDDCLFKLIFDGFFILFTDFCVDFFRCYDHFMIILQHFTSFGL